MPPGPAAFLALILLSSLPTWMAEQTIGAVSRMLDVMVWGWKEIVEELWRMEEMPGACCSCLGSVGVETWVGECRFPERVLMSLQTLLELVFHSLPLAVFPLPDQSPQLSLHPVQFLLVYRPESPPLLPGDDLDFRGSPCGHVTGQGHAATWLVCEVYQQFET